MFKKINLFLLLFTMILFIGCKKENDVINVGLNANFPPFESYEKNKLVGLDVELAEELGKKLNKKIVFKDMAFDTLLVALTNNKIDAIISGMDITVEREKMVNFTNGYFSNEISLIVKKDNESIKNLEDLKKKTVGVVIGTTSDFFVSDLNDIYNIKFKNSVDAILNLNLNKVDAIILDKVVAKKIIVNYEDIRILDDVILNKSEMGIAVNKNNPKLLEELNSALNELKNDGTLEALIQKHIYFNK